MVLDEVNQSDNNQSGCVYVYESYILFYLSQYLYNNALFYAERLYHIQSNEYHLNLWAQCYYSQGKYKQAYYLLQGDADLSNRYLFAIICIRLNKYDEAERALLSNNLYKQFHENNIDINEIPGGSSGLYLLGQIARKQHRFENAIKYLKLSLKYDPMLWGAYAELSELGESINISDYLPININKAADIVNDPSQPILPSSNSIPITNSNNNKFKHNKLVERITKNTGGFGSPHTAISLGFSSLSLRVPFASPNNIPYVNISNTTNMNTLRESDLNVTRNSITNQRNTLFDLNSPSLTPITPAQSSGFNRSNIQTGLIESIDRDQSYYNNTSIQTPNISTQTFTSTLVDSQINSSYNLRSNNQRTAQTSPKTHLIQATNRKVSFGPSARLSFSSVLDAEKDFTPQVDLSVNSRIHDENPTKFLRTTNDTYSFEQSLNKQSNENKSNVSEVDIYSVSILAIYVTAYNQLSNYKCNDCIATMHLLPSNHFQSGFSYEIIGRAYFESNDYKACVLAFKEMLRLEPFHIKGCEYLSSALWHMKKEKELCSLAQQVVEIDRLSSEVWCVVGNCFSLQHEPDNAIKFFNRSIQLDETFVYGYTLIAHEYVHNEDFDKAISSYRLALLWDKRHYNAWYGLGVVYNRQERYELAEYHFRISMNINSYSSVLSCYMAMVLHSQGDDRKTEEAIDLLDKAISRDPRNAQLHFQKAHILFSLEDYSAALNQLEYVKQLAPKEPPIYTMLGRVCQKLGLVEESVKYLQYAIDLDPKEANGLKMELDQLNEPNLEGLIDSFQI